MIKTARPALLLAITFTYVHIVVAIKSDQAMYVL